MIRIAGISFCGPVSEGPHGRRPIWPISKPMVRESSLSGTMGVELAQLKLMIDIASGEVKDHEVTAKEDD